MTFGDASVGAKEGPSFPVWPSLPPYTDGLGRSFEHRATPPRKRRLRYDSDEDMVPGSGNASGVRFRNVSAAPTGGTTTNFKRKSKRGAGFDRRASLPDCDIGAAGGVCEIARPVLRHVANSSASRGTSNQLSRGGVDAPSVSKSGGLNSAVSRVSSDQNLGPKVREIIQSYSKTLSADNAVPDPLVKEIIEAIVGHIII